MPIHSQIADLKAMSFQMFACVQDTMMFYSASDDMVSLFGILKCCSFDAEVI
jgi:hypothetical protein